ncbi:MAG: hypothetical protein ACUVSK_08590 [Desulfotomaculales bacterium]
MRRPTICFTTLLVELTCVVVAGLAGLIFAVFWLTREHEGNAFPVTLGVGYTGGFEKKIPV